MSTNNHDKGVFSTIDDDDDDDDLNDYGQFSFENIDKSKQIKRQKTSSNYKHDKNVDSNVESSSVIQNDQAKSKYGDHDDDTTLKLFVTTLHLTTFVKANTTRLDVNLGPSIEIENSSLQNVEQMNEPDKCQQFVSMKRLIIVDIYFKNQSERIGQCFDILQSPEQARIDQILSPLATIMICSSMMQEFGRIYKFIPKRNDQSQSFEENLSNNFLAIPFIYILFVKIAIHNLKNSTPIDLLTIELIDSIPYHFGILLQN
ncbi:hypothetical protein DERF_009131 [Dermatophagoides farinae]|uniref:Uncharacterized protein n=1 Tax=Dermatophagoides farinae TaxID=6954 RepID=A0A922L3Q2_DERFA|nr:hypothetical protein DERF_009131 [Dermatophagoides farinae]